MKGQIWLDLEKSKLISKINAIQPRYILVFW